MTALHDFSTASVTPLVELVVAEDVDDCSAARLRDRLEDALRMRPVRLVVDLSRCAVFDVSGLRVLLEMHCEVMRGGGRLVLRAPTARVLQVIELSGLQGVFAVEDARR
ncbi:MAG: STAS domain-containing protein [Actinomycetota bacterium]|jgi:anti-anti-sigma factor|nr:STAS domain-containing protein [Actinomycetota bacterium]